MCALAWRCNRSIFGHGHLSYMVYKISSRLCTRVLPGAASAHCWFARSTCWQSAAAATPPEAGPIFTIPASTLDEGQLAVGVMFEYVRLRTMSNQKSPRSHHILGPRTGSLDGNGGSREPDPLLQLAAQSGVAGGVEVSCGACNG